MENPPILALTTDAALLEAIKSVCGASVEVVPDGDAALKRLLASPRELVLCDLEAKGADPLELVAMARAGASKAEVIALCSHAAADKARVAIERGAFAVLRRPLLVPDELALVVRRAREKQQSARDSAKLSDELAKKNKELEDGVRRVELAYVSAQKAFRLGSELVGRAEASEIVEAATIGAGQVAETGRALYLEISDDGKQLTTAAWSNVARPPATVALAEGEADELARDVRRGRLHPRLEPGRLALGTGAIFGAPVLVEWKLVGVMMALLPDGEDAQNRATTGLRQVALAAQQAITVSRAIRREREVALVDAVSGLYNRRYVEQFLRREVARAQRMSLPLSAILLHLDVPAGESDDVLKQLAHLIDAGSADEQLRFRGSDIAARIAGEDVLVLMPETPREGALEKARRAVTAMASRKLDRFPSGLNARAGVAEFPRDAANPDELLAAARTALSAAAPGTVATTPWEGGVAAPTGAAARRT